MLDNPRMFLDFSERNALLWIQYKQLKQASAIISLNAGRDLKAAQDETRDSWRWMNYVDSPTPQGGKKQTEGLLEQKKSLPFQSGPLLQGSQILEPPSPLWLFFFVS